MIVWLFKIIYIERKRKEFRHSGIFKKNYFLALKITLVKKDKVGGLTLPTFKTHYTAIIIQKD